MQMSVSWSGSASGEPASATTWLRDLAGQLGRYASGAYQNYIDPFLEDWATAYYGANLPRLRRVKRAEDPDDVFRFAQSIPLTAGGKQGASHVT
jgi:FAD/FMN-containing dehydrogenase